MAVRSFGWKKGTKQFASIEFETLSNSFLAIAGNCRRFCGTRALCNTLKAPPAYRPTNWSGRSLKPFARLSSNLVKSPYCSTFTFHRCEPFEGIRPRGSNASNTFKRPNGEIEQHGNCSPFCLQFARLLSWNVGTFAMCFTFAANRFPPFLLTLLNSITLGALSILFRSP